MRQKQVGSLQELTAQLLPEADGEDSIEAREKLHVIGNKLRLLLRQVGQDLGTLQKRQVRDTNTFVCLFVCLFICFCLVVCLLVCVCEYVCECLKYNTTFHRSDCGSGLVRHRA